jgi:AbrB family looped-hinge helix DNA binding protein
MTRFRSSVSPKGQVTIPAEIRKQLGVRPRDHVVFHVVDNSVRIEPERMSLESIYGAARPVTPGRPWHEIEEIAREEHAARAAMEGIGDDEDQR